MPTDAQRRNLASAHHAEVAKLEARVALLEQQLAEARKDAERYRWLRNESWGCNNQSRRRPMVAESIVFVQDGAGNVKTILAEDAMDAAIDAAIARTQEQT